MALSAAGVAALAFAAMTVNGAEKAHIVWMLAFEILNAFGFANLFPVGIALYARAAPKTLAGTMMGVYYLHLFMCNNLVGWLGGLIERMSGAQFWFLHVGLISTATLLLFAIAHFFGHYFVPES